MSVSEKISARLQRMKRGTPFSINGFYSLGSHTSVQKAMSRLTKEGIITRVSRGYYVRPKPLKSVPPIQMTTSAEQVARAWARDNGYKLVHQGQESAYRLGLQTQAPVKTIFWSNGPSRRFSIGNEVVEIRHTGKQKLRWAGLPEGALLRSLSVLLPESVELPALLTAFKRLSLSEQEAKTVLHKLNNIPLTQAWQQKLQQFDQRLAS